MGVGILLTVRAPRSPRPPPPPSTPATTFAAGNYVVTLAQDPIASYDGSVPGIRS